MKIIQPADGKRFSMKVVTNRTGLTAHVIRAWERRYGAVKPRRDHNNRRFYSERDIERLTMLKLATEAGFSIGQIADYGEEELKEILDKVNVIELPVRNEPPGGAEGKLSFIRDSESYIQSFLSALEQMDTRALENIMVRAETELGLNTLIERFIIPLMEQIGDLWRRGELRIANEHVCSHVIRTYLGGVLASHNNNPGAPHIVVATPVDQWHDIGSLITAVVASTEGWNVTYLGASLPAEEIAGAAAHSNSRAVALSIIYPSSDPAVIQELRKLRRSLRDDIKIIVNGRAKDSYSEVLDEIDALTTDNLGQIRKTLESLRS
jgi:DNA-binding transcriptional MerR regulator